MVKYRFYPLIPFGGLFVTFATTCVSVANRVWSLVVAAFVPDPLQGLVDDWDDTGRVSAQMRARNRAFRERILSRVPVLRRGAAVDHGGRLNYAAG